MLDLAGARSTHSKANYHLLEEGRTRHPCCDGPSAQLPRTVQVNSLLLHPPSRPPSSQDWGGNKWAPGQEVTRGGWVQGGLWQRGSSQPGVQASLAQPTADLDKGEVVDQASVTGCMPKCVGLAGEWNLVCHGLTCPPRKIWKDSGHFQGVFLQFPR